ncbi:MAG: DUF4062 domain-containing protein [Proteobacteria bacterium]|nr:DUF4062 domain-containing protein [Pseudomonadota bacterium]
MISSTANDLPAYRDQVKDACLRASMFPKMMEQLPAVDADALNVLARIEQDVGHTEAAVRAATEAFCKAWCDGQPFAYHLGLEKARQLIAALGAPEPELPAFDESKYEPMPEVEINPADKFGG